MRELAVVLAVVLEDFEPERLDGVGMRKNADWLVEVELVGILWEVVDIGVLEREDPMDPIVFSNDV